MPIYEYVCRKCNNEFEQLVFEKQPQIECPKCGSKKTKKVPSVFAHKSDSGFTASSGGSSCSGCSASSCSGCNSH